MDQKPNLPEQIMNLPTRGPKGTIHTSDYLAGHRDARQAAAELAAAALSAAPAQEPVGEPLTLDQRYWLDRRGDIIAALEAEGLQIWSDKDRVWLHRLSASPLPQEPQEGKELTDAASLVRACAPFLKDGETPAECTARNRKDAKAVFLYYGDAQKWRAVREQLGEIETEFVRLEDLPSWIRKMQDSLREARAIERELRGAQEVKAGEWLPIESAPKDGTQILLTNGKSVAQGWWEHQEPYIREKRDMEGRYIDQDESDGYDGWLDCEGGMLPDPTHWQPLPPPPSATIAASREGDKQ